MADSPAHRSQNAAHNAAQKRKAAEMAAREDRVRCRTPAWSVGGLDIRVRSALVSLMSTSQRTRGGPREHVIYEGSRAHPIFAALACVKCVEEARMTILVGR